MKFRLPSKKSKIINLNPLQPEQKKKSRIVRIFKWVFNWIPGKKYILFASIFLLLCIVITQIMITAEYINTHSFQWRTPIILQTPLVIKRTPQTIKSPYAGGKSSQILHSKPLSVKELLKQKVEKIFGIEQWSAADYVVSHESNYNLLAVNAESGSCGLSQALPCSKLLNKCPNMGDANCQTDWFIEYVKNRYGNPENAMISEVRNGWY